MCRICTVSLRCYAKVTLLTGKRSCGFTNLINVISWRNLGAFEGNHEQVKLPT